MSDDTPRARVPLIQTGDFKLHSGAESDFKIECDALTDDDWESLAQIIAKRVRPFGRVVGVPRGGLTLATKLQRFVTTGPTLVVDDVLTSGASMEDHHYWNDDIGIVIFARGPCPDWITPLFDLNRFLTEPI